jgi:hypothetical protein
MPFGAFECLLLPMGVMPLSDFFQAHMVHLFANMGEQRPYPYIDNILHFKGTTFEEHISIINKILKLHGKNGLQGSAKKSPFCQESLKYLGFQLTLHWIPTTPVMSECNITHQSSREHQANLGFFWDGPLYQESHPTTRQDKVKAEILETTMLEYPDPNQLFNIYTNTSSTHAIRALLVQDGKVVSMFSCKLNNAQLKYTVIGQELLAAVKACKHFTQIIRDCKI